MGERVKAAVAGADFSVLPAVEYDYSAAIKVDVGDDSAATSVNLPVGLCRLSVDVDSYFTVAPTPTAVKNAAASCYLPAGAVFHEVFSAGQKLAVINKTAGQTGALRIYPAKTVE